MGASQGRANREATGVCECIQHRAPSQSAVQQGEIGCDVIRQHPTAIVTLIEKEPGLLAPAQVDVTVTNLHGADTLGGSLRLVEPVRAANGNGRRMPHDRQESAMADRIEALVPDAVVLLERGSRDVASLRRCGSERAERGLVTSTYMAGELRRYWSFAATVAAGTGFGPAHPAVSEVASAFADAQPCFVLTLGRSPGARLTQLLAALDVAECA